MKENRWTSGSPQRFKNSPSSVGAYRRKTVRLVSHREYGEVGAFMLLPKNETSLRYSRWGAGRPEDDRALNFCRKLQFLYI